MKKIIMLVLLGASFFVLIAAGSNGHSKARRGVVIAEPLACLQEGQKLICFDGTPIGTLTCKDIGDNTVLCSPQK